MGRSWEGRTRKTAWVAGTWGWEWGQARNRDPQRQLSPGTLSELRAWVVVSWLGEDGGWVVERNARVWGNAHAHIRKLSMKARAGGQGGAGAHGSETPPFGGMVFVELSASCVLAQLKSGTQLTLCSATGYGKQRWGRPPEPIEPTAVSTTISQRRSCGSTTTGNNWIVDFFASGRASRGGRRRHHCRRATARARAVELNHRRRRAAPRARANIESCGLLLGTDRADRVPTSCDATRIVRDGSG